MNREDEFGIWNNTGDDIPLGACLRPAGGIERETGCLIIGQPNGDNQTFICVLTGSDVLSLYRGQATFRNDVQLAYDPESGEPDVGDSLGTRNGSWLAHKGGTGFRAVSVGYGGWVNAVRDNSPSTAANAALAKSQSGDTVIATVQTGLSAGSTISQGANTASAIAVHAQSASITITQGGDTVIGVIDACACVTAPPTVSVLPANYTVGTPAAWVSTGLTAAAPVSGTYSANAMITGALNLTASTVFPQTLWARLYNVTAGGPVAYPFLLVSAPALGAYVDSINLGAIAHFNAGDSIRLEVYISDSSAPTWAQEQVLAGSYLMLTQAVANNPSGIVAVSYPLWPAPPP